MSGMSGTVTTVDLLRHGECKGGEIYRGSTDVPLTESGWQQMESSLAGVRVNGEGVPWQKIISSPLQRCLRFAESKASALGIPLRIETAFREMHFGDWEGRSLTEVWQSDTDTVKRFYTDPGDCSPPNGESMSEVKERLIPAWEAMLTEHRGEHILLVQHGGTIRVLLSWLLQMPFAAVTRLEIPYAGLSRVRVFDDGKRQLPTLVFMNRVAIGGAADE